MPKVLLGIGSNVEREKNIRAGLVELELLFGHLAISPIYETQAVGFAGSNFLNLVVAIESSLSLSALAQALKAIEYRHGRKPDSPKFAPRSLDVDILVFGDHVGTFEGIVLPREEMLSCAFVLKPLADLVPEELYPATDKSYASLWSEFDAKEQYGIWQSDMRL